MQAAADTSSLIPAFTLLRYHASASPPKPTSDLSPRKGGCCEGEAVPSDIAVH